MALLGGMAEEHALMCLCGLFTVKLTGGPHAKSVLTKIGWK